MAITRKTDTPQAQDVPAAGGPAAATQKAEPPKAAPEPLTPMKKDSPILAALPYILGLIVGLLIYLIEKEDRWVRFHALQAILLTLAYSAIGLALGIVLLAFALATMGIGVFCVFAIYPLAFATILVNIWLAYRAYKGEYFELPVIGEFAARHI